MKTSVKIVIFLILLLGPLFLFAFPDFETAAVLIALASWTILFFWVLRGLFRFFKKAISSTNDEQTPAEIDKEIKRLKKESEKNLEEFMDNAKDADFRDLQVDSLIMMMGNFGDTINLIKEKSDPLVRMVVAHMFIEQLSEDYHIDNSSVGSFAYELFKSELTKEDWELNFGDADQNDEYFKNPVFWTEILQGRISDAYKKTSDATMRSNVCADFCTDLFSGIDDDSIKEKFINLSREKIKEAELYSSSAESTYTSVEF